MHYAQFETKNQVLGFAYFAYFFALTPALKLLQLLIFFWTVLGDIVI